MVRKYVVGAVVLGACLVGCQSAPKPAAPPGQAALSYETIRSSLHAANPSAQVGQVEAVLPERNLAAVGDVQVQAFQLGDPITFLNNRMQTLTLGTIVNIEHGMLHVHYDAPAPGGRAPEVGDIAVRVSEPLHVPAEPLAPVTAAPAPASAPAADAALPAPASAPAAETPPPPPPPAPATPAPAASEPAAPPPPAPPAPAPAGENKTETPPPPPAGGETKAETPPPPPAPDQNK